MKGVGSRGVGCQRGCPSSTRMVSQTFASVYKGCRYKMNNDLSRANKEAKVTLGWSAYSDETVLHES
jgi:hypothetical protein